MEPIDLALMVLRVWLAVVMIAHGRNHVRAVDRTARWFGSVGFRHARVQARVSGWGEVAVGGALALGFLTPFAAAGLIAIMTVAFGAIHRFAGFFVFARPDEGYEYVVTLVVAALVLATLGPGGPSVDAAIGLDLSGWVGGAVALAGVVAGVGHLVLFWRRDTDT